MSRPDAPLAFDENRRQFLRTGVFGALALSTVSTTALLTGCSASPAAKGLQVFRDSDVKVLTALIPAVMKGALPADGTKAVRIAEAIHSLDDFLSAAALASQKQILQLFDLLSFPLTRYTVAGLSSRWEESTEADVEAFLQRWSESRIGLLRGGLLALSQLISMGWYLQPSSWAAIGYQPPHVVV